MATKMKRPGPVSLFRGKVRKPVSLTLTPAHHLKVKNNKHRLDITRADLIGLLIEKYADSVTKVWIDAYKPLRDAVATLGGTLEHHKQNEPRGGTWVLTFGDQCLKMPSEQSQRYPDLDACYKLKDGVEITGTWEDRSDKIDPAGLARLFLRLALSETIADSA